MKKYLDVYVLLLYQIKKVLEFYIINEYVIFLNTLKQNNVTNKTFNKT